MGSGISKGYFFSFIKLIKQYPVALDVAIPKSFKIPMKLMFPAMFRQRFFPNKMHYNFKNFIYILMAFFYKFEIFFKLLGECKVKHWLNAQIFSRFINGFIPFRWNVSTHNSLAFLNGGKDFCIKRWVFGMQGAIIPINTAADIFILNFGFFGSGFLLCSDHNCSCNLNIPEFWEKRNSQRCQGAKIAKVKKNITTEYHGVFIFYLFLRGSPCPPWFCFLPPCSPSPPCLRVRIYKEAA